MDLFQLKATQSYTTHPEQSYVPTRTEDTYKIFYLISGNIEYSVEGNIYPLSPGDLMILTKLETHYRIFKKITPYTRINALFKPTPELSQEFQNALLAPFHDRPFGCFNHFPAQKFPKNHWEFYLKHICNTNDPVRQQVYLMSLLQELADGFPQIKTMPTTRFADRTFNITHYINKHLSENLTLEQLCEKFFISKAQINRNFKATLGTTVGEYILTKRLVMAKSLMLQGKKPTSIFLQCGFNDYSTFFKAYKKKFGYSPKEESEKSNYP